MRDNKNHVDLKRSDVTYYNFAEGTSYEEFKKFWKNIFLNDDPANCCLGFNFFTINSIMEQCPEFLLCLFDRIMSNTHNRVHMVLSTAGTDSDDKEITKALIHLMPVIFEKHFHLVLDDSIDFNESIILLPGKSVVLIDSLFSTKLEITNIKNSFIVEEKEKLLNSIFEKGKLCFTRKAPVTARWVNIKLPEYFAAEYSRIKCISDGFPSYIYSTDDYEKAFPSDKDIMFNMAGSSLTASDHNAFKRFLSNPDNEYRELNIGKPHSPHFYFKIKPTSGINKNAEELASDSIQTLKAAYRDTYGIKFLYKDKNLKKVSLIEKKIFRRGYMLISDKEIIIRYHLNEAQALCTDSRVVKAAKFYFDSMYRQIKDE